jgi:peptidoglycan/LPS O-acetylase OafA/YrhL
VIAVVHPRARLARGLLGRQPLRWLGLRSYSVYLWHWPVFMLTRPQLDVPLDGLPLLALRFGVTIVLAELSYRFVETPIRGGALGRIWRALREAQGALRWRLRVGWAGAAGVALVSFAVVSMSVAGAQRPGPPSYLAVESIHIVLPAAAPSEAVVTPDPTPTVTATARPKLATFRLIPTARPSQTVTPRLNTARSSVDAPRPSPAGAEPTPAPICSGEADRTGSASTAASPPQHRRTAPRARDPRRRPRRLPPTRRQPRPPRRRQTRRLRFGSPPSAIR